MLLRRLCYINMLLISFSFSEITTGIDTLKENVPFDFSNSESCFVADLTLIIAWPHGGAFISNGIKYAGNDTLYNYNTAPDDTLSYSNSIDLFDEPESYIGNVYYVLTCEYHYAIFKVVGVNNGTELIIQWLYQDDGTPCFTETAITPFRKRSWGDIKQLFSN